MKVAVTGSDGFIGSAVVRHLLNSAVEVVEVDKRTHADVLDIDLKETIDGCTSVIHLAGLLGTEELFSDPYLAVDVNIKGSLRVLEACASTGASYVGISMPNVWANVYQATKQCSRTLATAWHRNFGVGVSHVRAFNVFGPGQSAEHVQKLIPTFATRAWRNEPLPIWGDGLQQVDLIHVDDVAQVLIAAIAVTDDRVIDAGTGCGISVLEVSDLVLDVTHSRGGVEFLRMRKGEDDVAAIASGEGWDVLTCPPTFKATDLIETINSYKNV